MIGYGDRARTQCEVVRLFRETHPDLPPLNQGTISKIEAQYREMGHVRKVLSKRQAVVDDDTKLNLLLALEENPIIPARQLSRDSFGNIQATYTSSVRFATGSGDRKNEKIRTATYRLRYYLLKNFNLSNIIVGAVCGTEQETKSIHRPTYWTTLMGRQCGLALQKIQFRSCEGTDGAEQLQSRTQPKHTSLHNSHSLGPEKYAVTRSRHYTTL
ncbi:hypothetical protein NQ318_013716 [Aromia moschata]|uniref:DUF4817 domain-containing protein n=1 Tax=Aromia moschata TaxID=1265417 RepID=A0AAV8Z8W6_9CUCU|nr:hypothetical protein NQ318_013716 [Aromia moschata]